MSRLDYNLLSCVSFSIAGIIDKATMLTSRFKNKQIIRSYLCLNTLKKEGCSFYSKLGPCSTRSLLSHRTELFLWASAEELKELFSREKGTKPRTWGMFSTGGGSQYTHPKAEVAPCQVGSGVVSESDSVTFPLPGSLTSQAGPSTTTC